MTAYSKDFKRDALKYIEEHPEVKIKDVADRLGIPVGTLYDWNKKRSRYNILGEDAPPSGPLTEEEKEILYICPASWICSPVRSYPGSWHRRWKQDML